MKYIYQTLLFLFTSASLFAQGWQEIDLTTQNLGGFIGMTEHKGKLFGTSFNEGLVYSTDGGASFNTMTTDTLAGTWSRMFSAGNRLFINTWVAIQLNGKMWYTEDEGVSWNIDTAGGIPSAPLTHFTVMDNNHAIGQWQGDDQYYRRNPMDAGWTRMDTFYKNSNDPNLFAASNDTLLAATPLEVQYSADNGETWTFLPDQGLPFYMGILGFDFSNGRIYLIDKQFGKKPVLYYSDNFGNNWDSLSIRGYFDKNHFGTDQVAYFLKAFGDDIWISIENDASNSVINLIHSSDRGASWQYDTLGFHTDPFGTDAVRSMFMHKGEVYAVCALGKAYKKAVSVGQEELLAERLLKIYPNPVRDILKIEYPGEKMESIKLLDLQGNIVRYKDEIMDSSIEFEVRGIARGTYILELTTASGTRSQQVIIE